MNWILYITSLVLPVVGAFLLLLSLYSAIRLVITRTSGDPETVVKPRIKLDLEFTGGQSSGQTGPWLLLAIAGTVMLVLGLNVVRPSPGYYEPLRLYDAPAAEPPGDQTPVDPAPADPVPANPPLR
jgi:hypothetical protein